MINIPLTASLLLENVEVGYEHLEHIQLRAYGILIWAMNLPLYIDRCLFTVRLWHARLCPRDFIRYLSHALHNIDSYLHTACITSTCWHPKGHNKG